jgi:peptide deformylase
MYAAPGIGLAATQVDVHKRIIVDRHLGDPRRPAVFVNPEIVATDGEAECEEGCLSVPGYYERVRRAAWVKVRAQDAQGQPFELGRTACWRYASSMKPSTSRARSSSTTFRR